MATVSHAPPRAFAVTPREFDAVHRRVVREAAGTRVTVFQKVGAPSPDVVCIARVSLDTVVVRIDAPYTLPFTVRLERAGESDTVLVVRRRP